MRVRCCRTHMLALGSCAAAPSPCGVLRWARPAHPRILALHTAAARLRTLLSAGPLPPAPARSHSPHTQPWASAPADTHLHFLLEYCTGGELYALLNSQPK